MRRSFLDLPRVARLKSTLVLAALALAGCGSSNSATVNVVAIGDSRAPFQTGARLSPPAQQVRAATAEGLVAFDQFGQAIPALADRWIVTDDGRSYIFRLREGTWPNNQAITAESARAALNDAIFAAKGTPLALDLAGIEEIRAMAGRVIEIRLVRPRPNMLQLLAQPELGLTRGGLGVGPMRMKRAGAAAVLTPLPPEDRGQPPIAGWEKRVRPIKLEALPAKQAVDRFNTGEADILLGGTIDNFGLARSVGLIRGAIQLDPVSGLFGLIVVHDEGFLATVQNREAIAMAIDREKLIAPFGVSGWVPSAAIVPSGIDRAGVVVVGQRWLELDLDARRAQARARVAAWRAGAGAGATARLRIALPGGAGGDLLFSRLNEDLAAIGVEAVRAGRNAPADLRLVDVVERFPNASWYLNQLNCVARRGLCDPQADDLADAGRTATDRAASARLFAEAEARMMATNIYIAFGPPIRWSLVRGDANGFATNRWGVHPLMPMAIRPK